MAAGARPRPAGATGEITTWPIRDQIAAVSVGIVGGVPLLDLEYVEDQVAEVDMNVVATAGGALVEIQGTGRSGASAARRWTPWSTSPSKGSPSWPRPRTPSSPPPSKRPHSPSPRTGGSRRPRNRKRISGDGRDEMMM